MGDGQATGAEWLARSIKAAGTMHVFFIDAVLRRTLIELGALGVTRVLAHAEKAAAYMADGYARVAGQPGICFAQSVGAANLAAGLQDAFLGRSPVIALTGRKPPEHQHRNAYQEVDHAPLFAPVTKFSAFVQTTSDLPRLFRQAWREAVTLSPRPVHLDLNGLTAEPIETGTVGEQPGDDPTLALRIPPHRPTPADDEIESAAAALRECKRVAIVAGAGAIASGARGELLRLAERLTAPVATSLGGRGIVPTRHPLSVGVVGNYSAPPANRIVHGAEMVLFVGCHTGDQVTHTWRVPPLGTPVVQVDIDPVELGRSYPRTLGLMGDPKTTLAKMIMALGQMDRDRAYAVEAQRIVDSWQAETEPLRASDAVPIRVERLCAEITEALPEDGILVADTGYSGIWTSTMIELNGAGQTYLRAAGSLGWAFPASLGAQCAAPNRKVLCFTGDGGLYYHLTELETARRRNIPVVVVVNNNSGFGQSWPGIRRLQGNRAGDPGELARFGPTNFAEVARGFGVRGVRVEEPGMLGEALRRALAADEPVLVDVVTDIEPRAPEPWAPGA
jgi:acetolactate synthase-1/2/3 large subunit